MSKEINTEEKIKQAAKEVFMAKGFDGCSTREIAKAAGMNVALVNYYFRSKQQLFKLIYQAASEDLVNSMVEVFSQDLPLEEKVRHVIERQYAFLTKHPELPGFIVSSMNRGEDHSMEQSEFFEKVRTTGIFEQCLKAQAEGYMRPVNMYSLTLLIMSNCDFPFMSMRMMQGVHCASEDEIKAGIVQHKEVVIEMLINYLFPKNQK